MTGAVGDQHAPKRRADMRAWLVITAAAACALTGNAYAKQSGALARSNDAIGQAEVSLSPNPFAPANGRPAPTVPPVLQIRSNVNEDEDSGYRSWCPRAECIRRSGTSKTAQRHSTSTAVANVRTRGRQGHGRRTGAGADISRHLRIFFAGTTIVPQPGSRPVPGSLWHRMFLG
jgi:hypothetical protein